MSRNQESHPLQSMVFSSGSESSSYSQEETFLLAKKLNNLIFYESSYTNSFIKTLPPNFEPQNTIWKDLLVQSKNQGKCGSCWAFASAGCYADRFNILSGHKFFNKLLSVLTLVLCNDLTGFLLEENIKELNTLNNPFRTNLKTAKTACNGNSLVTAFYYFKVFGVPRNSCLPYNKKHYLYDKLTKINWGFADTPTQVKNFDADFLGLGNYQKDIIIPSCFYFHPSSFQPYNFCYDNATLINTYKYGTPAQNFNSLLVYKVRNALENPDNIKAEIFKWGPVCSSFLVYQDFYSFNPTKDGVYIHDPSFTEIVGGHAIEIVGWGEYPDNKGKPIPFWWVKNSWGHKYGYNGYFRFLRGKNQCEIENNVICMLPNLFLDFKDKKKVLDFLAKIDSLDIFYEIPKNNKNILGNFFKKIVYTLGIGDPRLDYPSGFKIYKYLYLEVFLATEFLSIGSSVSSLYNSEDLKVAPGLDYSSPPGIEFPTDPEFMAGKSSLKELTFYSENYNNGNFFIALLLFFSLLLVFLIVLFLLFFGFRR